MAYALEPLDAEFRAPEPEIAEAQVELSVRGAPLELKLSDDQCPLQSDVADISNPLRVACALGSELDLSLRIPEIGRTRSVQALFRLLEQDVARRRLAGRGQLSSTGARRRC